MCCRYARLPTTAQQLLLKLPQQPLLELVAAFSVLAPRTREDQLQPPQLLVDYAGAVQLGLTLLCGLHFVAMAAPNVIVPAARTAQQVAPCNSSPQRWQQKSALQRLSSLNRGLLWNFSQI